MNIPAHRKNGRITLEQFQEHKNSGMSIKAMPKTLSVSKNHVQFLSALDQGKFSHIDKEMFLSKYKSGMSLEEIAIELKVPYDYIGFLREHFDISRLGPKFINRKKTEKPLTNRQKEIIIGSLMGDAGKMSSSSVKMKQSVKQKEYLLWKFTELHEHASLNSLKEEQYLDKRYNKVNHQIRFYTNANTDIETILSMFYKSGHKTITPEILNLLTPLGIAVWFMDDGTTDWKERQILQGNKSNPSSLLCTDSFSLPELEIMCEWFEVTHGIIAIPKIRQNPQSTVYRIFFNTVEHIKLLALISPYIIPSMKYKVDYEEYKKHRERISGNNPLKHV